MRMTLVPLLRQPVALTNQGMLAICGLVVGVAITPIPSHAQVRNPCDVVTKTEAEALVGGPLIGPELSPSGNVCRYYEAGYGEIASRIKLVYIGVFVADRPDVEAVNTRRLAVVRDRSLLPSSVSGLGRQVSMTS